MKGKTKVLSTLMLFLMSLALTIVLIYNQIYNYLIVVVPVTLIAGFYFITEFKNSTANDKEIYEKELNRILRMYDGILVNINKFPKLKNKSVLHVSKIEDLVDAQAEMRKPIYYVKRESATAFYLLNDDIFLIYFLKMDENELSGLEAEVKRLELEGSLKIENFKDFDKTFILQTDEKSYKVSPIREKKEEKVEEVKETETTKEETTEVEDVEVSKQTRIEETKIEDEIIGKEEKKEKKEEEVKWDSYFKFGDPNYKEELPKLENPIEKAQENLKWDSYFQNGNPEKHEERVEEKPEVINNQQNNNQMNPNKKKKKKKKKNKNNNQNNVN